MISAAGKKNNDDRLSDASIVHSKPPLPQSSHRRCNDYIIEEHMVVLCGYATFFMECSIRDLTSNYISDLISAYSVM